MSHTKNTYKLTNKSATDNQTTDKNEDEGNIASSDASDGCTYAVTVSKKGSNTSEDDALFVEQKSFISIHSTDHLQMSTSSSPSTLECNVEVISLNEVFPSTSDESLSNDDEAANNRNRKQKKSRKNRSPNSENAEKSMFVPTNSKSSTGARLKDQIKGQPSVHSDFDIAKGAMYNASSNPGESKVYPDSSKKMSKTMKKLMRNIDKHMKEQGKGNSDKALSKLTTMRGILKDGRCVPECTGDSALQDNDELRSDDASFPYAMDFGPQSTYSKTNQDKNVTFNTQVVIIHFTGDLCVGQSVETLSKEKDQQARNSELRKTFLTKYNEFWPTQK